MGLSAKEVMVVMMYDVNSFEWCNNNFFVTDRALMIGIFRCKIRPDGTCVRYRVIGVGKLATASKVAELQRNQRRQHDWN